MKMNILAFTGKRGHGKSTAAEALVRKHGYVHLNFADPLREVCHLVYGVSYHEMLDPVLKEKVLDRWPFKSPRELLQQIGTEMFRNYIPDTWIENWKSRALTALASAPGVVCSDCRFLNEAGAVEGLGGRLIKVERPSLVHGDAASLHQSEMEIDLLPVERVILNDQSTEALETAAVALLAA
jgi:hypothetical protein